jgi:hypothetical protein
MANENVTVDTSMCVCVCAHACMRASIQNLSLVIHTRDKRSSWRVITMRTEPQVRKARPMSDVTSTALGKEDMAVRLYAIQDE